MKELAELVELVSKQKVKKVEVIGNPNNYSSKMKELYEGISNGKILTDEDAISILYQGKASASYKKLKYRLQNRLINTIFFIDINKPSFNDTQKAYYNCYKSYAAVNILFGRYARNAAINLAEKTIRKALEFEFSEIVLNLSKKLSRHYGTLIKDYKKYEYYSDLTQQYVEIYQAETLAEEYLNHLLVNFARSPNDTTELLNIASKHSRNLKKFKGKVKTNQFLTFFYYFFYNVFEIKNDTEGALKICKEAIQTLEAKHNFQKNVVYLFYSKMLVCYTKLKDYHKGEMATQKALELLNKDSLNWFNLKNKYLILSFHTKNYQNTLRILFEVQKHKKFNTTLLDIQETWKINEAFVHFFVRIGKIEYPPHSSGLKFNFRVSRFLNEVPNYSKDKRGFNIPILILKILFLLEQKKYGKVIDKVEALNTYCYRYLKKDDTFRSNCFIKMLLLLPKCNFHRTAVERKANTLFHKLQSVPLEVAPQTAGIEIVPYEHLWEIVLNMVENKFYKKGRS